VRARARSAGESTALVIPKVASDLQFRPSITGWTPDLVGMAGAAADVGNLRPLADLVDAMFADDRVDGVLQSLTFGTLGLPLKFAGGDAELAELLKGKTPLGLDGEWNAMHPEPELTQFYNWGIMLGAGLAQRKALPRLYGQPQRYRLKCWHPRFLSYDHAGASGSHWRVQTRQGMRRVVPGGEFILFLPFGESRPWNQGKWRRCAFPWLIKHFAAEDRANQGEMVGSPVLVGKSKQGGTERNRQRFLAELRLLARNGRIVLPEGWDLEMLESDGKMSEIFESSIEWGNAAITISIASQTTTTEGSPGFDSGKPQEQILASVTRYYAKAFAQCLHENSTRPWAAINTGDADNAPCGYWVTDRANSQAAQATIHETMGRAISELDSSLAPHGIMVDAKTIADNFGIATIKRPTAMPLPPGPRRTPPTEPGRPGPPGQSMNEPVMP